MESKNKERVVCTEREKRAANFIVYGIKEDVIKDADSNFIKSFLGVIGIDATPKSVIRLGQRKDNTSRPVKVTMNTDLEKDSVMSRLINLKDADEVYKKLSVRDDYTIEERELVREWSRKAAKKNEEEHTNEWKVRGTPKNGLRLVKIAKR